MGGWILATALLGLAGPGPLPPYAESIRCAGLAEAASQASDGRSQEGRRLFDAAMFWGLAASEGGRKEGVAAGTFKSDQVSARLRAAGELAPGAAAKAELDACVARVPPLEAD